MKKNKYLVDFDTEVSVDNKKLRLLRNNEVFEELEGIEALGLLRRLVRIEELEQIGFSYCFLEYDDLIDEWYEKVLVPPSVISEGVTMLYHPERDVFEIPESGIEFTEMAKVQTMIKAFAG